MCFALLNMTPPSMRDEVLNLFSRVIRGHDPLDLGFIAAAVSMIENNRAESNALDFLVRTRVAPAENR